MSTTQILTPTSLVQFGLARTDITPPSNIYHPLWGAARHQRATGVHRPLMAEVMAFGPTRGEPQLIRAQLDLPGLVDYQHDDLLMGLSEASGLPKNQIVVSYSHTHAAGWFTPDRFEMPGGELITPYLQTLRTKLMNACRQALDAMQEATITYGQGRCSLAANRDYWDDGNGIYACGYNPDAPADETLIVARVANAAGQLMAVVVNYGCHPTTLAWENTLISPDYIGAMREVIETTTGAIPIFALGACGDLGPKEGFVGDLSVADRNGRQLGYAALSILEAMPPLPAADFHYQGPVISGATLGTWAYRSLSEARLSEVSRFSGGVYSVDLLLKPRPDPVALQQELDDLLIRVKEADARGDVIQARNYNALAERARRWIARLNDLPEGSTTSLSYSVYRMGDALWITCGGEPYNIIQVELRRRFPNFTLLFSPVASELQVAYLLPADRYGKGLYQEEPSILAPGCLETLTEAITDRIKALIN
jgi:hypothetical protein